jgi:hypothetical protein
LCPFDENNKTFDEKNKTLKSAPRDCMNVSCVATPATGLNTGSAIVVPG